MKFGEKDFTTKHSYRHLAQLLQPNHQESPIHIHVNIAHHFEFHTQKKERKNSFHFCPCPFGKCHTPTLFHPFHVTTTVASPREKGTQPLPKAADSHRRVAWKLGRMCVSSSICFSCCCCRCFTQSCCPPLLSSPLDTSRCFCSRSFSWR